MLTQQDLSAIAGLLADQEKHFDEKLDSRFAQSESMLLDEIDRYYNLNKSAIQTLSDKFDIMQMDLDALKSRSNVLDMYKITNNHEKRICALEERIS